MTGVDMSDTCAISQVVLTERQGMDRGWRDQQLSCFREDSTVRVTWFQGSGPEFVAAATAISKQFLSGGDGFGGHRMGPILVKVVGDRAVAECSANIDIVSDTFGARATVRSHGRAVYRMVRTESEWKIYAFEWIYEHDELIPAVPGQAVQVDLHKLAEYRVSYQFLSYFQGIHGVQADQELPGEDRPELIAAFYQGVYDWLESGQSVSSQN